MSALDRTEDPQSSSPLFAAFTMVFFIVEVFGYEGLPHVGFLIMSLALAAAMVLIGICMYVIPDAGSTEPTDQPDAPAAPAEQDDDAFAAVEHPFPAPANPDLVWARLVADFDLDEVVQIQRVLDVEARP